MRPVWSAPRCCASSPSASFPVSELRAYASERSLGRKLPFAGGEVTCEILRAGCFDGLDLVIVDVDDPLAAEWAPQAAAAGARVVDNSAAFRMDPDIPLVIAEVNPDDLRFVAEGHRVVPQLHHDDSRDRARAAAPRGAHRSVGRVVVPVGVGRGPGRHARARRAVDEARRARRGVAARGHARRADRRRRGVVEADRRQRDPARRFGEGGGVHVGGVEDDPRDPQDPPRRRHQVHGHVRARAGLRRPRGVGQRAFPPRRCRRPRWSSSCATRPACGSSTTATATRHRSRPRVSIRCSSAVCAKTRRNRDRSTCGSPATTCARARPSTPCRWPRSSSTS